MVKAMAQNIWFRTLIFAPVSVALASDFDGPVYLKTLICYVILNLGVVIYLKKTFRVYRLPMMLRR